MKAEYNASQVYENAKTYADDILADLERFLGEYKRLVEVNRRDLDARSPQPAAPAQPVQPAAPAAASLPSRRRSRPRQQPRRRRRRLCPAAATAG